MRLSGYCLSIASFCLSSPASAAQCPAGQMNIYPQGGRMDSHSLLIIIARGEAVPLLEQAIDGTHSFYLQSGFMIIPLLPLQFHRGAWRMSEIILKPQVFPETGAVYTLHCDLPDSAWVRWLSGDHAGSSNNWTVTAHQDNVSLPSIEGKPELVRMSRVKTSQVVCQVRATGNGPLFAEIILENLKYYGLHKRYKKFVLPLNQGEAILSGEPCGSAFVLDSSGHYAASLSVMDLEGNESGEIPEIPLPH